MKHRDIVIRIKFSRIFSVITFISFWQSFGTSDWFPMWTSLQKLSVSTISDTNTVQTSSDYMTKVHFFLLKRFLLPSKQDFGFTKLNSWRANKEKFHNSKSIIKKKSLQLYWSSVDIQFPLLRFIFSSWPVAVQHSCELIGQADLESDEHDTDPRRTPPWAATQVCVLRAGEVDVFKYTHTHIRHCWIPLALSVLPLTWGHTLLSDHHWLVESVSFSNPLLFCCLLCKWNEVS